MSSTILLRSLRIDKRMLWLIAMAGALVLGELSMRAWEAHQTLESELGKVRSRAAVLATSSDQIDWADRTRKADTQRLELQTRLWQTPSEAQAQARLRDWLMSALRTAAVARPTVNLLPLQAAPVASGISAGTPVALRVRATVNFDLAPNALENALLQIEAGGQLARIDSLSVAARNRRVEMTVSVPVLLRPETRP